MATMATMATTDGRCIGYVRVSTAKQGASGLGLEAQQAALEQFVQGAGWQLLETFVEVESGRKSDRERPQLARAIAAAKMHRAVLLVASLDRLTRSIGFLQELKARRVDFRIAALPDVTPLVVDLLVAIAEHEAALVSSRTKAALARAKARGVTLGGDISRISPAARERGRRSAAAQRAARAADTAEPFRGTIAELRAQGVTSYTAIGRALERRGVPTPGGQARWHVTTVRRLLQRLHHGRQDVRQAA